MRARHIGLGDAVQRGLLVVDDAAAILRLVVFDVPVDIHHAVGVFSNMIADLCARCAMRPCCVGAVDLGDQRLSTGGPGGTSATLMRAPNAVGDRMQRALRTRLAIAWLCAVALALATRFTWMSATFGPRRRK